MRCPVVAQATCLVEQSNQHHNHYFYYHCQGGHFQYYRTIYYSCGGVRGEGSIKLREVVLTLDVVGKMSCGTTVCRPSEGSNQHHHCHCHRCCRRGGHYYFSQ